MPWEKCWRTVARGTGVKPWEQFLGKGSCSQAQRQGSFFVFGTQLNFSRCRLASQFADYGLKHATLRKHPPALYRVDMLSFLFTCCVECWHALRWHAVWTAGCVDALRGVLTRCGCVDALRGVLTRCGVCQYNSPQLLALFQPVLQNFIRLWITVHLQQGSNTHWFLSTLMGAH